jgi:hypothetical protein
MGLGLAALAAFELLAGNRTPQLVDSSGWLAGDLLDRALQMLGSRKGSSRTVDERQRRAVCSRLSGVALHQGKSNRGGAVSTGAIIAIVVGAIVVVTLIALSARAAGRRRDEHHRHEADELRQRARQQSIQAESVRASADAQAADAKRAEAEADERAAQARLARAAASRTEFEAEHMSEDARSHHDQARALDPDASDTGQDEALAMDQRSR